MFSCDDTIVAIATPPGRGGIGVVRLSGPAAHAIAQRLLGHGGRPLAPRYATFGRIRPLDDRPNEHEASAVPFDHVVCTFFPGPQSYTGDDVVEMAAHGSPVVLARIVAEATRGGARLARPGEFTLRAYVNGRVDLVQAEAVADLVEAVTPAQAQLAFSQLTGGLTESLYVCEHKLFKLTALLEASVDFPEEGYHFVTPGEAAQRLDAARVEVDRLLASAEAGRLIREGGHVVILGRPNVGKSTIFNALLGTSRAIVTEVPGTTRDLLTETCDIEGIPLTLVDTAGVREAGDDIEREGVSRARQAARNADLRLLVLDASESLTDQDVELLHHVGDGRHLIVANKIDRPRAWDSGRLPDTYRERVVSVSALAGLGMEDLRRAIASSYGASEPMRDTARISNIRHIRLLERARVALARGAEAVTAGASEEYVLADLREALEAFAEVTGARTSDAVLAEIFERFCIGK